MPLNLLTLGGATYHGDTPEEVRDAMAADLTVEGPRTLYAQGDGYEVQVSLESDCIEFIRKDGEPLWLNDKRAKR